MPVHNAGSHDLEDMVVKMQELPADSCDAVAKEVDGSHRSRKRVSMPTGGVFEEGQESLVANNTRLAQLVRDGIKRGRKGKDRVAYLDSRALVDNGCTPPTHHPIPMDGALLVTPDGSEQPVEFGVEPHLELDLVRKTDGSIVFVCGSAREWPSLCGCAALLHGVAVLHAFAACSMSLSLALFLTGMKRSLARGLSLALKSAGVMSGT